MTKATASAAILLLAAIAGFAPAAKAAHIDDARCASMHTTEFADMTDAPTTIETAAVQPADADLPAYCKVDGYVTPQVGFELRLPTDNWNGRFLMQGCGGMCGALTMETSDDALIRGYAVVKTNMGHEGNQSSGWATNQYGPRIDFGYRATHVAVLAAKALLNKYYGKPQQRAYYRGCSTGGRQGMVEAQRFPNDFDGVIAGSAPLDESGDAIFHLVWSARASVDANGGQIIDPDKIPMVHEAALRACDGEKEGFIRDPRTCHFDPASLRCKGANGPTCLTDAEVVGIKKIYDGARDSKGRRLFPGGMQPGSELEWVPMFIGKNGVTMPGLNPKGNLTTEKAPVFLTTGNPTPMWLSDTATAMIRKVMLQQDPGPSFSTMTLDFDTFGDRLRLIEPLYSGRDPDLRAFKAHGAKLIMFHGWNDAEVPTNLSIDYYDTAMRTMGGLQPTREFFRLFVIPGMAHCRRGPGPDGLDLLTAMENWVEKGVAPDYLRADHMVKPQTYMGLPTLRYPLKPGQSDWSRPVYAYPATTVWTGKGDFHDPANWVAGPAPQQSAN